VGIDGLRGTRRTHGSKCLRASRFGAGALRGRVRAVIQQIVDEELIEVLRVTPYGRSEVRRGYRNGSHERPLVTEYGHVQLRLPRA